MEEVNCDICGIDKTKNIVSSDKFNIVQCQGCGLVYMNPRPDKRWLSEYYVNYYLDLKGHYEEERLYKCRFKERLDAIEKFKDKGRLLDIGCGVGFFLQLAKERKWQVSGIEFSPLSADIARASGVDVLTGSIEDADLESGSFDVITMWHVIEHLQRPSEALKKIYCALKKGGVLALETPNMDYYFKFKADKLNDVLRPEHLYNFSSRTLARLLENSGFTVLNLEQRPSGTDLGGVLKKYRVKGYLVKHLPFLSVIREPLMRFRGLLGQNEVIVAYAKK